MNLIFTGLAFVAVGIWRVWRERQERQLGHTHKCRKCGATWHHKRQDWPTVAALAAAHTCPKCGAEQFEIDTVGNISTADAHAYGAALQSATTPAKASPPREAAPVSSPAPAAAQNPPPSAPGDEAGTAAAAAPRENKPS